MLLWNSLRYVLKVYSCRPNLLYFTFWWLTRSFAALAPSKVNFCAWGFLNQKDNAKLGCVLGWLSSYGYEFFGKNLSHSMQCYGLDAGLPCCPSFCGIVLLIHSKGEVLWNPVLLRSLALHPPLWAWPRHSLQCFAHRRPSKWKFRVPWSPGLQWDS